MNRREALKKTGATLFASSSISSIASGRPHSGAPDLEEASSSPFPYSSFTEPPLIYPNPREIEMLGAPFLLDQETTIVLPSEPSTNDLLLSRFLREELSDRFDLQLRVERVERLPVDGRIILTGAATNPLISAFCQDQHLELSSKAPGPEGYILRAGGRVVLIAGSDEQGAFYGLQSLRQLVKRSENQITVAGVHVRDWPVKPFRGIKLYLPGRAQIPYFNRFVRYFAALYKFNTLQVEMNACMRLDRHPELNQGWIDFARDCNWSRRNYPPGPLHDREQNSSHQDCCDGSFIEKSEVASLVHWSRQHYLDFVPEIPSLTHSFYLLSRHKDLSEVPGEKWPDTYCPSNPRSHQLLFSVMDEIIEVARPEMVHAGHDEWFAPFGLCPACKGKDPGELFGRDLRVIHDHLSSQGVKMAIWGDYLLENVRGQGLQRHVTPTGWVYHSPGAMTPQQVRELVPKDILISNWFWSTEEKGEEDEAQLDQFGFKQIYGNMEPTIPNYLERSKRESIIGGAPSSWAATTEFNMNKDLLRSILGASAMLWSGQVHQPLELSRVTQSLMPQASRQLSGVTPPSDVGDPVIPVNISSSFNRPLDEASFGVDLRGMAGGRLAAGKRVFELGTPDSARNGVIMVGTEGKQGNPLPREVRGIKIGIDVTSLIFLHACATPANNREAYRLIWDEKDSADLLGWYEVVYEDGLVEVLPIRYGINILEWNWAQAEPMRPLPSYCYGADAVRCGGAKGAPPVLFAYEWTSPRLGKVIKEVHLKGSTRFRGAVPGFENAFGQTIPNNAIILKAISYVGRRG
jgi:hypothetical protein